MGVYTYKDREFTTRAEMAEALGITIQYLHEIIRQVHYDEEALKVELERVLHNREKKKEIYELADQLLDIKATNVAEIRQALKDRNVLVNLLTNRPIQEIIYLVYYATRGGYEWVIQSETTKPFVWEGVLYKSKRVFYHAIKASRDTLYAKILETEGNLAQAIKLSHDKIEYGRPKSIYINNTFYNSVLEASEKLDFSVKCFRKCLREGYTNDEAYKVAKETSKKVYSLDSLVPVTLGGKKYKTAKALLDDLVVDRKTVIAILATGKTLKDVYAKHNKKSNYVGVLKGNQCYKIQEVLNVVGVSYKTFVSKKEELGSMQAVIDYYEANKLIIHGEEIYSPKHLGVLYGIHTRSVVPFWNTSLTLPKEERVEYLAKACKRLKEQSFMYTYKGKEYTSKKNLAKALGVSTRTLTMLVGVSSCSQEYVKNIEQYVSGIR